MDVQRVWRPGVLCALAALITSIGLAGCNQILGLDQTEPGADAAIDTTPDASASDARSTDATAVDAGPTAYRIRGVAAGLVVPVVLRLRATGFDELLSVTGDGEFAFAAEFLENDSYQVELDSAPDWCTLDHAIGMVGTNDPHIDLWCGMLSSLGLESPRVPELPFSPTLLSYQAVVSRLQDSVLIDAVSNRTGIEIAIADHEASSESASEWVPLMDGGNEIPVVASHPNGASLSYELAVHKGDAIAQAAYVKAGNTGEKDWFGSSVALSADGTTLAIGAVWEDSAATGVGGDPLDDSAEDSGAVYIFDRVNGAWEQTAYLKANNTGADDQFGHSIALSDDGDLLAVGAYTEQSAGTGVDSGQQADDSLDESGAVYIFERVNGEWTENAYIKASNTGPRDLFGFSVDLSGDGQILAVGAQREDSDAVGINGQQVNDGINNSGAVYIFRRMSGTWSQTAYIKASNTGVNDLFGSSVALDRDGDILAVGAIFEASVATQINGDQNDNSGLQVGAVYTFHFDGMAWAQEAYIKASNADSTDFFGHDVALSASGDTLAVGAYGEASGVLGDSADNSAADSGAAYVFQRDRGVWTQQAYIKASNLEVADRFGERIGLSASGDTLAVGAHREQGGATGVDGDPDDNTATNSGAVYVYQRASANWSQKAYIKASNTQAQDFFGQDMALSASGGTLAIGASKESSDATGIDGDQTNNDATSSGAAYILE